jgi:hypothetical protein
VTASLMGDGTSRAARRRRRVPRQAGQGGSCGRAEVQGRR